MASNDVLRRYDEVRDVRIRPQFREESYKHILVPVYSTSYYYEGKLYQVAINGQTGNIAGAYPKSPAKIAAIVVACALLLAAIFYGYASGGGARDYYGEVTYEQAADSYASER